MNIKSRHVKVCWRPAVVLWFVMLYCSGKSSGEELGRNSKVPTTAISKHSTSNFTATTPRNTTTTLYPTTCATPTENPFPSKESEEEEHASSLTIFFVLLIQALCILVIHLLIKAKFSYLPESVAVVCLGAAVGLIIKALKTYHLGNWQKEEAFHPTAFFLILLPPIIFESGYNLHKGNFFANIGSIMVFAVLGTAISAVVVGGGIYLLGKAGVAFHLTAVESFAFGSLISAVDPVATLAIFHALNVDPTLNMLVFGESILNDAVAIVLTKAVMEHNGSFMTSVMSFLIVFLGSAAIGVVFALLSALVFKHVDLRQQPSLELGMILVFSYAPYGLAEGLKLSGIMAILFCGIVMSHYTHFNLSPVTQITVQHLLRTTAFVAETLVFAYLGMAIFSFKHRLELAFVIWTIILVLVGRAVNIFPLAAIVNFFRETKISRKNQFIMWFSGLRGAIAFALSINLQFDDDKRHVLITSTLIIVLFTLLILGGSTLPLLKVLKATTTSEDMLTLSKTQAEKRLIPLDFFGKGEESVLHYEHWNMLRIEGTALDADTLTDDEWRLTHKLTLKGFVKLDAKYFIPFFTRKITREELRNAHDEMQRLASQWYSEVRSNSTSEDDLEVKFTESSF